MKRISPWVMALTVIITASPAWAGTVRELPEPSMVGLVALGVAGAIIAARLKRRK